MVTRSRRSAAQATQGSKTSDDTEDSPSDTEGALDGSANAGSASASLSDDKVRKRRSQICRGSTSSEKSSSLRDVYQYWASVQWDRFRADEAFAVHEKPHQIFWGAAMCLALIYVAFFLSQSGDAAPSFQRVCLALLGAVSYYSFLQTRDGLLIRPHPGLWRVVHGVCLFHFLFMVALMVLSPSQGRRILCWLFSDVCAEDGKDVFEGTLVVDCRINRQTILRQLKTPWFTAHAVGYCVKMLMFRDWKYCLCLSIMFELCELSFQWLVPEFRECWWDSIFLDAFGANVLGMLAGAYLLRYLEAHEFDWLGSRPALNRLAMRFVPFSLGEYNWRFFSSPSRLLSAAALMVMSLMTELNVFFFMYSLALPAKHWIHVARLLFVCGLSVNAVAEHYEYMNTRSKRIGHNEWLMWGIILAETLVNFKYGRQRFANNYPPLGVIIPWSLSAGCFCIWCVCYFKTSGSCDPPLKDEPPLEAAKRIKKAQSDAELRKMKCRESNGLHALMARGAAVDPLVFCIPFLWLAKYYI